MDSDYRIIKRMRQGDEDAFELFVRKYYEDILRYCIYQCNGNEEDAKDLTQDTFLRFFENFSRYKHKSKAKNYLYTIAGNLCVDNRRLLARTQTEPFEEWMVNKGFHAREERESDKCEYVYELMQCLPEEYREVLVLYYFNEMKQHEIAEVLGIGLPLVKYRLRKAKEKLKTKIRGESFDEF